MLRCSFFLLIGFFLVVRMLRNACSNWIIASYFYEFDWIVRLRRNNFLLISLIFQHLNRIRNRRSLYSQHPHLARFSSERCSAAVAKLMLFEQAWNTSTILVAKLRLWNCSIAQFVGGTRRLWFVLWKGWAGNES